MYSMTGYGKGVASENGKTISIELKTVNHRYLDYNFKLGKTFLFLEDSIKKTISSKLSRGHLDFYITYEQKNKDAISYSIDENLANAYIQASKKLQNATNVQNDLTLTTLLKVPDIVCREQQVEDEDELKSLVLNALNEALDNLKTMRKREGESLYADINQKLLNIRASLDIIEERAPQVVEDYRVKLDARIKEIMPESAQIDENRLATEVAIFADRCAIDEETTRLSAHIVNMKALLDSTEPVGRKLDFLVQEFNRETNTIGSKANDVQITKEVLKIKNEIEKIREQAQNIE